MSHQLHEAFEDWRLVEKYIQQCPHVPTIHPAIQAALRGLSIEQCTQETQLKRDLEAAFRWEQHVNRLSIAQQPLHEEDDEEEGNVFSLHPRDLHLDGVSYLLKEVREGGCDTNRRKISPPLTVRLFGGRDITHQALPGFVEFLNQSKARVLEWWGVRFDFTMELDDNLTMDDVPLVPSIPAVALEAMATNSSGQLTRLISSPKCHLTGLATDRGLPPEVLVALGTLAALGTLRLQRIDLREVCLNELQVDEFVSALSACRALESVEFEIPCDYERLDTLAASVERLLNDHNTLRSIQVSAQHFEEGYHGSEEEERGPVVSNSLSTAVQRHPTLEKIEIPLDSSIAALSLIWCVGESRNHLSVDLGLVVASKNQNGLNLEVWNTDTHPKELKAKFFCSAANIAQLHFPEVVGPLLNMFLYGVSDGVISNPRTTRDVGLWEVSKHLENYTLLEKVEINLGHVSSLPFQGLCPASRLKELRVGISNESPSPCEAQIVRIITVLLLEQPVLEHFEYRSSRAANMVSEASREELSEFANALGNHGSLLSFAIKEPRYVWHHASHGFIDCLLGAVATNRVLDSLDITGIERRRIGSQDTYARLLPQLRVRIMYVPEKWMEDKEGDALARTLQHNTSIRGIGPFIYPQGPGPAITKLLARNQLLHWVGRTEAQSFPTALWPVALSKLGSSKNHDYSPLYLLLKKGADRLHLCSPTRKRVGRKNDETELVMRNV